jgi:hypothetical protein
MLAAPMVMAVVMFPRVFACFDKRLTEEAIRIGFFDGFVTDPGWMP